MGVAWLVMAAGLGTGCARQVDVYDEKDWVRDETARTTAWRDVESLFGKAPQQVGGKATTLRGVRHDLMMPKTDKPDARCSCLDVVVGEAGDRRLRWQAGVPVMGPGELAFAMRTEGSSCAADAPTHRRPSIFAVDRDGANVIVVVEELPLDRPQALGAILERPGPGGALYVRSRPQKGKSLVYAHGPAGAGGMCKVLGRATDGD